MYQLFTWKTFTTFKLLVTRWKYTVWKLLICIFFIFTSYSNVQTLNIVITLYIKLIAVKKVKSYVNIGMKWQILDDIWHHCKSKEVWKISFTCIDAAIDFFRDDNMADGHAKSPMTCAMSAKIEMPNLWVNQFYSFLYYCTSIVFVYRVIVKPFM